MGQLDGPAIKSCGSGSVSVLVRLGSEAEAAACPLYVRLTPGADISALDRQVRSVRQVMISSPSNGDKRHCCLQPLDVRQAILTFQKRAVTKFAGGVYRIPAVLDAPPI